MHHSCRGVPTLAEVERDHILDVLERCGGKKPDAAGLLGISLKTLYNKLNQYAERRRDLATSLETPFALRLAESPLDCEEAIHAAG